MKFWPFNRKQAALPAPAPKAPQVRMYAAASYDRLVSDWFAQATSLDSEIRGSLRPLRQRARQLERDNDFVRQFLRVVENNVIGRGIPFQAQVKMQRGGKLADATNLQIETEWKRWCRKDSCHVAGKLSFAQIERLVVRNTAGSGEILVRMVMQPFGRSKIPLSLEIIESDRLDDNYNGISEAGNEIRMGVEIDKWARPIAYYFLNKHPGDYQFNFSKITNPSRIRVPADEIVHVFITERPGQTRGVPWAASAIVRLHHLGGYEQATVIAARANASVMGFITTPEGEFKNEDGVQDNQRVTDFQPGVYHHLGPGENVTVPHLNQPDAQFDPFMRAMLRGIASGIGCSYESLSRDYSQSNYSSSRLALLDDRDLWQMLQDWITDQFHQVVFEKWLDMAILAGVLSFPDYETNPERYSTVRWMPRGWTWVDPQKEVLAAKEALRAGIKTTAEILSDQGDDFDAVMTQIKRERDKFKELGLVFDTDAALDPQPTRPTQDAVSPTASSPETTGKPVSS